MPDYSEDDGIRVWLWLVIILVIAALVLTIVIVIVITRPQSKPVASPKIGET